MISQFLIKRIENHLEKEGNAVTVIMTNGGMVQLSGKLKFEGDFMMGTDVDGDESYITMAHISGFTLAAAPADLESQMESAKALEAAFIGLRAACEVSKDKAVLKALADLVEVEEAIDVAEGGTDE